MNAIRNARSVLEGSTVPSAVTEDLTYKQYNFRFTGVWVAKCVIASTFIIGPEQRM